MIKKYKICSYCEYKNFIKINIYKKKNIKMSKLL